MMTMKQTMEQLTVLQVMMMMEKQIPLPSKKMMMKMMMKMMKRMMMNTAVLERVRNPMHLMARKAIWLLQLSGWAFSILAIFLQLIVCSYNWYFRFFISKCKLSLCVF